MTALMNIKYLECCCGWRVWCLKFDAKTAEQSKIQELFWIILELFGIICRDKDFRLTDPSPKQSKRVQIWTVQTSPI